MRLAAGAAVSWYWTREDLALDGLPTFTSLLKIFAALPKTFIALRGMLHVLRGHPQ